jgi:putative ABC transport system permease protein
MAHPLDPAWTSSFRIVGRDWPSQGEWPEERVRPVSPGYFHTVGVPIVAGRDFDARDRLGGPGAVIVNRAFVKRWFPKQDPIGQRIDRGAAWWPGMPKEFEVVGVVGDERFDGLNQPPAPATYFALDQISFPDDYALVRATADAATLGPAIREAIWSLDRDLPVEQIRSMDEVIAHSIAAPRFNAALIGAFAALALLLAALGIYGVLAAVVA